MKKGKITVEDDCEGGVTSCRKEKNAPGWFSHIISREEIYSIE